VIIGLIADTQGSFDIEALLGHVGREFAAVDEIWHAGDWGHEPVLAGLRRLKPLVVVNGNAPYEPRYPPTVERAVGRWRVGMIHNLAGATRDWPAQFDIVIHAHSHRWRDEMVGATRFINPGTATRPQFGGTERTMARLRFGETVLLEKLLVPRFPRGRSVS
jgi:predicted phosphodiesterase